MHATLVPTGGFDVLARAPEPRRLLAAAGASMAVPGLALLVALSPTGAALAAGACVVLIASWRARGAVARALVAAGLLALALGVAVWPPLGAITAAAVLAVLAAWSIRRQLAISLTVAILLGAALLVAFVPLVGVATAAVAAAGTVVVRSRRPLAAAAWVTARALARAAALLTVAAAVPAVALIVAFVPVAGVVAAGAVAAGTVVVRSRWRLSAGAAVVAGVLARTLAPVAFAALVVALALVVAMVPVAAVVVPVAGVVVAAGAAAGTVAVRSRRRLRAGAIAVTARLERPALAVAFAALMVAAALGVALAPAAAALVAAAAAAGTVGVRSRGPLLLGGTIAARTLARSLAALLLIAAVLVAAAGVAVFPVTVGVAAIVGGIVVLARRAPSVAFAASICLVGFEGSTKLLLALEPTPLPAGARAVGAAAIDLALFATIAGVLWIDRGRTPRALWAGASRTERAALAAVGAWLAISVLQVVQGGDLVRGAEGFRVFQAYAFVALGAAVLAARLPPRRVLVGVLAVGLAIALYAATRVAVGPADAEAVLAASSPTTYMYGDALRAIGSFSSAVGLTSYLTPMAIVGIVAGMLVPAVRPAAFALAATAGVGILGSYGRGPLVAIAVALLFAVAVLALAADVPRRRKVLAAAGVVCVLGVTYAGVQVASRASPELRERASGIIDPFGDESMNLRFATWEETLGDVASRPMGRGVGAVGAASAPRGRTAVTTDNSYLKVLLEQGILVGILFLLALLTTVVVCARRLVRSSGDRRGVGLAALAGFVGLLVLSLSGEYVEQPGKVVAWSLLGIAAALALRPPERTEVAT